MYNTGQYIYFSLIHTNYILQKLKNTKYNSVHKNNKTFIHTCNIYTYRPQMSIFMSSGLWTSLMRSRRLVSLQTLQCG